MANVSLTPFTGVSVEAKTGRLANGIFHAKPVHHYAVETDPFRPAEGERMDRLIERSRLPAAVKRAAPYSDGCPLIPTGLDELEEHR